ncbi:SLC25A17 [Symbiodinium sp. CCMP2592]|nr:SLC25A17 [Symbiodinium sp. CCMP2592]
MTADDGHTGLCQDCGAANREIFKDISDGGLYCKECWVLYYGRLPLQQFAPSRSAERDLPSSQLEDLLPEDAPKRHVAHGVVKYAAGKKAFCFRWQAAGQSIHFQTTIPAAGGSRTAAAVIARSCYVKFEQGWTKDRVRDFRNQCYAKLGGRVLTSSPLQKSFSQGTKESVHEAKESDPRAVASRGQSKSQAQCKGHRAHLMPETLHPAKRPRIDESPTKLQSSNSKSRAGQAGQAFLQPKDLKLILDDPQASLPHKEVRSIRSQGLGLGSQAIPASQPETGSQARQADADLEAPRGQAENSDSGFNGFFGCCGCCCQAHRRANAASGVRQKCPPPEGSQGRIITCSGRDQRKVSGNPNPGGLACGDSSPNVERYATTVAAAVKPPAPSAGVYRAQQQIFKHEVREGDAEEGSQLLESSEHSTAPAESQHRPESQPTPFCWDLPVAKIEESVPDSLPPFIELQDPVALPASPASIPVPDPAPFLESLPTPWFSQPTPQVQLSDLRYLSDLTPVPPKQEEDGLPGLPSSSIPVPVELAQGDQNCQRQMASQASVAAAPAVPSKPTGETACDPQDSPFATSLDVLSLTRDRLPPANFKQASDMAKPDSNFAALLLQRSRAAAASRGEAQRDGFKKEPLRKQRPLEDADSIDLPPAPCLTAVGRATICRCASNVMSSTLAHMYMYSGDVASIPTASPNHYIHADALLFGPRNSYLLLLSGIIKRCFVQ